MPYRVVYVDHVAIMSGAELALSRLLPWLKDYVDPTVLLGAEGPLLDVIREAGIPVEVLPMDPAARDLRKDTVRPSGVSPRGLLATVHYTFQLSQRLRSLQPDLVHTNSLKAALYGGAAGRLAGVPVIWHIRDRIAPDYLPKAAVILVKLAALVLPSCIIANSETTRRTLPRSARAMVVHNAVIDDSMLAVPRRAQSGDRPFRVCVLGRLAPWKGQDVFLRAFKHAFADRDDVEAWITGSAMFGEDDYAASLHALAERLEISDRVVFRGFKEDVWSELAEVDLLVHCSLTPEPFGQVVVEGLASGTPVIAAAEGGPAEVLTHMVDGFLVAPGDASALGSAMRMLYDDGDLRRRLAANGKASVARFSPEVSVRRLAGLYDTVIAGHRGIARRLRRPNRLAGTN